MYPNERAEIKKTIQVLVPRELSGAVAEEQLFAAVREQGRLVIVPLEEFGLGQTCGPQESRYRLGFMDGVVKGFEDGYHSGFYDAYRRLDYDPRYSPDCWTGEAAPEAPCDGECEFCPEYDEILELCGRDPL